MTVLSFTAATDGHTRGFTHPIRTCCCVIFVAFLPRRNARAGTATRVVHAATDGHVHVIKPEWSRLHIETRMRKIVEILLLKNRTMKLATLSRYLAISDESRRQRFV